MNCFYAIKHIFSLQGIKKSISLHHQKVIERIKVFEKTRNGH